MAWLGFSRYSYAVACFEPTSVELYQTGTFQMLYQLKEKKMLPGPGVDPAPFQLGSSVPFLRPFVHFSVSQSVYPNWQPLTYWRPCCCCRQSPPARAWVNPRCVHPEDLPSNCLTNKLPQQSPSRLGVFVCKYRIDKAGVLEPVLRAPWSPLRPLLYLHCNRSMAITKQTCWKKYNCANCRICERTNLNIIVER